MFTLPKPVKKQSVVDMSAESTIDSSQVTEGSQGWGEGGGSGGQTQGNWSQDKRLGGPYRGRGPAGGGRGGRGRYGEGHGGWGGDRGRGRGRGRGARGEGQISNGDTGGWGSDTGWGNSAGSGWGMSGERKSGSDGEFGGLGPGQGWGAQDDWGGGDSQTQGDVTEINTNVDTPSIPARRSFQGGGGRAKASFENKHATPSKEEEWPEGMGWS